MSNDENSFFEKLRKLVSDECPEFGYVIVMCPPDENSRALVSTNMDVDSIRRAGAVLMRSSLKETINDGSGGAN